MYYKGYGFFEDRESAKKVASGEFYDKTYYAIITEGTIRDNDSVHINFKREPMIGSGWDFDPQDGKRFLKQIKANEEKDLEGRVIVIYCDGVTRGIYVDKDILKYLR